MELLIDNRGRARCIYGEEIELAALGQLHITRASHVEPDDRGDWWADLSPVDGPRFGPFVQRSQALVAEVEWLKSALPDLAHKPEHD